MRNSETIPAPVRILAAVLLALVFSGAQAATFSAGIENSRWRLAGSIFECSLEHTIPEYGRAVFYHRAGEDLEFFLNPLRSPMRPGQAALVLEQPEWGGGRPVEDLGYVRVADSHDRPIELSESRSGRMMSSLRDGMRPTFTRRARHSDHPIRVRLNHVNFRDQYLEFQQCQSELLPVNFDQVRRTVVLFELDRHQLSDSARDALDNVALYVDADSRVEAIYVDGHTDTIGTRLRNRELSRERAQGVTDYLVEQGVPEDMIATRYHASRFPVEGVETPGPRHRRATIRLDREGDPDDPPTPENIVIVE